MSQTIAESEALSLAISKLDKDTKEAAKLLTVSEVRYLVDSYYAVQKVRVAEGNQVIAASRGGEPNHVLRWLHEQHDTLESRLKPIFKAWVESRRDGRWLLSQVGIGEVLSAGLMAHIDILPWKCAKGPFSKKVRPCSPEQPHDDACRFIEINTAGKVWRFAGLDPTVTWEKGQKRPWNARLKVLCWKAGESFKKFSNHPDAYYGHLYRQRKEQEVYRNLNGMFAEIAADTLKKKRMTHPETVARYRDGKLPDGRLDLRATRYAVKRFLSDYHAVAYECRMGTKPPKPWVIDVGGHADYVPPHGWPIA